MRNVYILTEGGQKIGFGHITRCLSFYQSFQEIGVEAEIIVNGDDSVLDLISDKCHRMINWIDFQDSLLSEITKDDLVIIDSYLAPLSLYHKIYQAAGVAAYIDDERRFTNYPGGVLINGDIHASAFDYSGSSIDHYLLGPKYQPLRKSFRNLESKKIAKDVKQIMITFGGSDPLNLTPLLLNYLTENYPDFEISVIIGKAFLNISEIEQGKTERVSLIYAADEKMMIKMMQNADIVITAAGQTLFELAAVGTPLIAISIFKEHHDFTLAWEKTGFIEYAGFAGDKDLFANISNSLTILSEAEERGKRSDIGRKLVDGKGASRVVKFLLSLCTR